MTGRTGTLTNVNAATFTISTGGGVIIGFKVIADGLRISIRITAKVDGGNLAFGLMVKLLLILLVVSSKFYR